MVYFYAFFVLFGIVQGMCAAQREQRALVGLAKVLSEETPLLPERRKEGGKDVGPYELWRKKVPDCSHWGHPSQWVQPLSPEVIVVLDWYGGIKAVNTHTGKSVRSLKPRSQIDVMCAVTLPNNRVVLGCRNGMLTVVTIDLTMRGKSRSTDIPSGYGRVMGLALSTIDEKTELVVSGNENPSVACARGISAFDTTTWERRSLPCDGDVTHLTTFLSGEVSCMIHKNHNERARYTYDPRDARILREETNFKDIRLLNFNRKTLIIFKNEQGKKLIRHDVPEHFERIYRKLEPRGDGNFVGLSDCDCSDAGPAGIAFAHQGCVHIIDNHGAVSQTFSMPAREEVRRLTYIKESNTIAVLSRLELFCKETYQTLSLWQLPAVRDEEKDDGGER